VTDHPAVNHVPDDRATQTIRQIKNGRILARFSGKSSKKCSKNEQTAQFYEDRVRFGGFRRDEVGVRVHAVWVRARVLDSVHIVFRLRARVLDSVRVQLGGVRMFLDCVRVQFDCGRSQLGSGHMQLGGVRVPFEHFPNPL
jgi:hypothetical protein